MRSSPTTWNARPRPTAPKASLTSRRAGPPCAPSTASPNARKNARDSWHVTAIDHTLHDVRHGLRVLAKSPGFTTVAVVTLALAIGANAVAFGIVNGLVLRPLDVPAADTLYGTEYGGESGWQSYPNYVDLRERNRSFVDLAAFKFAFVGLDTGHDPARATGFSVTGNYFEVLGIQPHLGRFFRSQDVHGIDSAPYLVLGYGYWYTHFQADPGVVGRVVRLNRRPFTIIGVAPPRFHGTVSFVYPDFFMPIVSRDGVDDPSELSDRANKRAVFEAFGHLKPGVTLAQATADVNAIAADLEKTYPKAFGNTHSSLSRQGLSSFGRPARAFVASLMLLAALILLAACANLGSLFAAHAADRSREVALRLALGASRSRILCQLLTEAPAHLPARRRRRAGCERRSVAPPERVADGSQPARARGSGLIRIPRRPAAGPAERAPVRHRSRAPGAPHRPLPGGQGRTHRPQRGPS